MSERVPLRFPKSDSQIQTFLGNDVVNGNRVVICACVDYNITKWLPTCTLFLFIFFEKLIFLKKKILWNCTPENGADLCVNEGRKLSGR